MLRISEKALLILANLAFIEIIYWVLKVLTALCIKSHDDDYSRFADGETKAQNLSMNTSKCWTSVSNPGLYEHSLSDF